MNDKDDFDELLDECLQDPEFREKWDDSENEWETLRAIYDARKKKTQRETGLI